MPKKQHDALERQARKKGLTGKAKDRFVYGIMNSQRKSRKGHQRRRQ